MSIDFQAFSSSIVLDTFQKKIEVLDVWNGRVLAGLADGTLVVLEPVLEDAQGPWQVVQALKAFSKKHAVQIQVSTEFLWCHAPCWSAIQFHPVQTPFQALSYKASNQAVQHKEALTGLNFKGASFCSWAQWLVVTLASPKSQVSSYVTLDQQSLTYLSDNGRSPP